MRTTLSCGCCVARVGIGIGTMPERTPLVGGGAMRRAGVALTIGALLLRSSDSGSRADDSSVRSIMRGGCATVSAIAIDSSS
jgi:hypothetical protein